MGISVLGPLGLDGSDLRFGRRDRVVLAALAVRPGMALSANSLIEALWGDDPPASATKVLQGCVVRLRKTLGADSIQTSPQGYRLMLPVDDVDAQRFERMVVRGRELLDLGDAERAAYVLGEALSLWRGEPFSELEAWDLGALEAVRLSELRLGAEELRVDAALRAGHDREVLDEALALVKAAPLRERRWALLARLQYQAGRQGEALRTIHEVKTLLLEQLGLDPGPELTALELAILRQDSSLTIDEAPAPSGSCPYRGLAAYDVDDEEFFFGRKADLWSCLEIVRRTSVVAVVGPSGSGKSSLARAGLAAALRRERHHILVVTPGAHPVQSLNAVPATGRGRVLVVDQCEEVFSLCEDAAERADFLTALVRHCETGLVVIAFRADRLADVSNYPEFARLVESGLYLLGGLGEEGLREAIEAPARQVGLLIEPGLVDLLVREVQDEPGALPLLSHALMETWKLREANTMTVAGYTATGGIRGAVAQSAERVYARVDPSRRPLLRDLVLRLVSPGVEGEAVRGRVPRRLVATDPDNAILIDLLVSSRLVTSSDGFVEIAHEALARAWPRLRAWLDDDIEGQRTFHHLTSAADAWDAMDRPDSELYRGVRLAQTLDWRDRTQTVFTKTETEFLNAAATVAQAEQVSARQHVRQQTRMIYRLRGALAGAALLLVVALLASAVALRQADRGDRNAQAAQTAAQAATEAALVADARRVGTQALVTNDIDESMLLAVAGVQLHDSQETRSSLLAALGKHPELVGSTQMQSAQIRELDVSPDGRTVVTRDTTHHVRLYDVKTGKLRAEYQAGVSTPVRDEIGAVRFSPDGRTIAVGMAPLSRRPVTLLDAATLEPLREQLVDLPWRRWETIDVAFSRDGRSLAATLWRVVGDGEDVRTTSGVAAVWKLSSQQTPVMLPLSRHWHDVALSPDGKLLYTTGPFTIYDLATGRAVPSKHFTGLLGLESSPDGELVATAKQDAGDVLLLDAETGAVRRRLTGINEEVVDVRFSSDGQQLASVTWNNHVAIVWDVGSGLQRTQIQLAVGGESVDFSPDGTTLYTAGYDAALRQWDLQGNRRFISHIPLRQPPPPSGMVIPGPGAAFVAYFYFAQDERYMRFLNLRTRKASAALDRGKGFTWNGGSWHPNGHLFAVAKEGTIRVWNARTGTVALEGRPSGRYVTEVDYSTDGSRLVMSELSGQITMLDAATLEPIGRPVTLDDDVCCVSAGPDNRTAIALTGGAQESASGFWNAPTTGWALVDLQTGTVLDRGKLDVNGLWVAFSPDGRHAAVAGADGELLVLDLQTGAPVREPVVGHNGVLWLTYSTDGSRILTGGADANIGLWDAASGTLLAHAVLSARFAAAQFLPDGSNVLIAQFAGDAYRWDTRLGYAIDFACKVAGRDFTPAEWEDNFGGRPYRETCPDG